MEHPVTVRCEGLVKRFGDITAVAGLGLEIHPGECFGMLGPNGAGKTTTVELLEGLTQPDAGVIELFGRRWGSRSDDHWLRSRIGVQLQLTQFADRLTVRETLRVFRSFHSEGRGVDALLDLLALREKAGARVMHLSGGQKQRLALACALVGAPSLLFLDEPSTGLDPQARLRVWEVVESFRQEGGSTLLTTHYMEEAARLCDRVAIVDHGKVIACGSPAELVAGLGATQVVELQTGDPGPRQQDLERLPGVEQARQRGKDWHLSSRDVAETLPAALALLQRDGIPLRNLATHAATLEDVFVQLTGRALRDG